jgi:hypothetical protein
MGTTDPVGTFLAGIEGASLPEDIFCEDVVLDATVPNWRFRVQGAAAVSDELGRWYADLGRFGEIRRNRIDDGELVEFTLSWQESGVPHACHQAHVIKLREDRIASDTVFCGGRWPEPLLAQMDQAQLERDAVPGFG